MSSADLKKFVWALTEGERVELRSYLRLAELEKDQARQADLGNRLTEGAFVDQAEVKSQIARQAGPRL